MVGYSLKSGESVDDGARRIGRAQLAEAIRRLERPAGANSTEVALDVRKRCKKVRSLVRLLRSPIGKHRASEITVLLRETGRLLAPIRDTEMLVGTFDNASVALPAGLPADVLLGIRARLVDVTGVVTAEQIDHQAFARSLDLLRSAASQIDGWTFDGEWDALAAGLRRDYRAGRATLPTIRDGPDTEQLHEWRKHVKHTGYHVRLLRRAAPTVLAPLAVSFADLNASLGEARDLGIVVDEVGRFGDESVDGDDLAAVCTALGERAAELERTALELAEQLYAETPTRFASRLGRYWRRWRDG